MKNQCLCIATVDEDSFEKEKQNSEICGFTLQFQIKT